MDDYHQKTDSVSKTMLSCFHGSPCIFDRRYVSKVERPPEIKAAIIGSIGHSVLLDGRSLDEVAMVYPDECLKSNGSINRSRRKDGSSAAGDWEATLDEHQYPVQANVKEQVASLLDSIRGHEVVQLVEQATAREQPIYWTDEGSGLACRCRPDFYHDMGDHVIAYDLKFTSQIKPGEFWRVCRNFKYWMQDAHYSSGIESHFGKPCKFVFWAIEDTPPFRVARYEYTQDSRENAASETKRTLLRLAECYKTGDWRDKWTLETNDLIFDFTEASAEPVVNWEGVEEVDSYF